MRHGVVFVTGQDEVRATGRFVSIGLTGLLVALFAIRMMAGKLIDFRLDVANTACGYGPTHAEARRECLHAAKEQQQENTNHVRLGTSLQEA